LIVNPGFGNNNAATALEKAATGDHYHVSWQEILNPNSATNKTGRHDISETLLKVALNTIRPKPITF
jgi:hypothetical protein